MNKSVISRVTAILSGAGFTAEQITGALLLVICVAAAVFI